MVADPPPSCAEVAARATTGSRAGLGMLDSPDSSERAAGDLARPMSSKLSITDRVAF